MVASKHPTLRGRRVLLIDDCRQITSLLEDVFHKMGATVVSINDSTEAMTPLQTQDFDLLMLDLIMPDLNGWDLLGFIESVRPALLHKTIILTGDRYCPRTAVRIRSAQMAVLYKPFEIETLKTLVSRIVPPCTPPVHIPAGKA